MAIHWIQLIVVTLVSAAAIFCVGYWIEGRAAMLHSRRKTPIEPLADDANDG